MDGSNGTLFLTGNTKPNWDLKISKMWGALFQEGGHTLFLICSREGKTEIGGFEIQPTAEISIHASFDTALCQRHRIAALGEDIPGHNKASIHQLCCRNNIVGKTDAMGFLGVDAVAGEDQLLSPPFANKTG